MRLNPDTGAPEASSETSHRGYGTHWRSRTPGRGRLIKEQPIALDRDEMLPTTMCVAGLRRFWFQLPKGSKRALARHLDIDAAHLRNIVKARTGMPEAYRRRLSRFLMRHARGEMTLKEVSPHANPRALWVAGKPSHVWMHEPASSPRIVDPDWIKAVEAESKGIVFHAPHARLMA